jgi:glycosyltransferase involved in cell wall biosynthesis
VPYGVDVAAFSGTAVDGMRERLGARAGDVLVLALGRLVEKKGFRYLLEAAARVPGLHVALAGEGDLDQELRRQAKEAGASVTFTGFLDRDGVARALAAADVVAVPSVTDRAGNVDGLPNTLLEALGAGRAVVASRVAGIPEVVEDGVTGLLVPPEDPPALAEALRRLAADPDLRRTLGERARQTAGLRYSWAAAAQRFEECYAAAAALDAR